MRPLSERMRLTTAPDWADEVAVLEARIKEYDASFQLYDGAMRRGTKMWQVAHPESAHTWPDAARLAAWLMEGIETLKKAIEEALDLDSRSSTEEGHKEDVVRAMGILRATLAAGEKPHA
jgi:hypothetical protein